MIKHVLVKMELTWQKKNVNNVKMNVVPVKMVILVLLVRELILKAQIVTVYLDMLNYRIALDVLIYSLDNLFKLLFQVYL